MSEYIEHVDIVAKVKTEADTSGLSEDIQKVLKKPFVLKLDADSSQLFNDIKKDVKSIQGQLEKALNGVDFSKGINKAFNTIDLSGLSEQIAKSIATGAQNGSRTIEEILVDLQRQEKSLNNQLQEKRLSLAQDWANKQYNSLIEKAKEMNSPQAVMDKLKKMKLTAKDLDSTAHIGAWVEKLENEFNTSNLKDIIKNLSNSLNLAMDNPTNELKNKINQIQLDFKELDSMRVKPEFDLSGLNDALNKIQDYKALMDQTIMENSEVTFGNAIQGIYNTSNTLQNAMRFDSQGNALLNVNGIANINSALLILAKSLGTVKNEAGKFDFSNSIATQFEKISSSISQLIPKIEEMSRALSQLAESNILPSSAYEEQIKGTKSNLDDLEKQLDQRQKRIKEIQDAINTPTDKGEASQEKKYIASAKNTANKLQQGELVGNQTYAKYEKGLAILKEYLSLGGKLEDLNIRGGLDKSSAVVQKALADESVISSLEEGNKLIQEREKLLSQLATQEKNLAIAQAKEGTSIPSQQQEEIPEEVPKETSKPKKPHKDAISQEDFLNVRDTAEENARKIFDNKGYKYFELSASQAENGLAKVTAKVKDASDQWRSFNAVITETGDLISPKFGKKPLKNQSKIEDSYLDSETESIHLTLREQQDAVDRLRTELDLADKEKWSISVDESGFVTIQNNLQQIGDEAYQAVQKFRSVEEAVDNFNIKAKKSVVSYSNEVDDSADKQLKKIMELSSSGKLSSNEKEAFSTAERYNSLNKLGISNYANLKIESGKLLREITTTLGKDNLSSDDISKVISDYERFTQILKQVENAAKDAENQFGKILDTAKLQDKSSSMLKWLQNNPLANGEFGEQVRNLAEQIKSAFTQSEFDNISAQFSTLVNEATSKGLLGKPKQTKDTSLDDAKKKAEQAKKILDSLNDHSLAANMEAVNNKVRKFTDVGVENDNLNKAVKDYEAAYKKLVNIQQEIASGANGRTFANSIDDITSSMKAMTDAMDIAENKMKELKSVKDTLTEVDKIITNWGKTQNDIKRLENLFTPYQLGGKTDSTQNQIFTNMQSYLNEINTKGYIDKIKSGQKLKDPEIADLVNTYHQLTSAIKDTDVAIKSLKQSTKGMLTESDKIVSANKIEKWLEDNSRAAKEYGEELKNLANQMRNASTVLEKEGIMNRFNQITSEAGAKGLTGRSWWGSLKETFSHISQIFGSYQLVDIARDAGQKMIQYSRDVDSAMTQLRMATGVTKDDAKELMETYSQMGDTLAATGVEVAASTTEWLSL